MIKLLKKAIKWYCEKSVFSWTPSCMFPYIDENKK